MESVRRYGLWEAADRPEKETMVTIPDMPCQFEMKKGMLPIPLSCAGLADFEGGAVKAEVDSDGVVLNGFDELEAKFTVAYEKLMGNKAYNIGPLSLCDGGVQAERGNKSSIDQGKCLSWLDSHKPGSVVYVSFGTLARLRLRQVMEIGEAMKGSGRPVVWVLKQGNEGSEEIESWVSRFGEGLEWMVILGWAPQVAILSHAAVGGFVTHCGWNSTLEGLCAGVPMVTWPHFWEQFVNERLVMEVLKCSYSLIVMESVRRYGLWDASNGPEEKKVVITDMPCRFEMKKRLLPVPLSGMGMAGFEGRAVKAEVDSDGVVINSFDELEVKFTEAYEKLMGKKAYNMGPLFLCEGGVQAERGNKSSIDKDKCLSWFDSHEPGSVVYVSFGSLTWLRLKLAMEIGEALKGSGRPVVWVVKQRKGGSEEIESWVSQFGEGLDWLVIVGWAPQVAILSHKVVGGFVTHCGWNSTLEGLCAGVPMVTWPHFWEQFVIERLVVEMLKVGVGVGIDVQIGLREDALVGREEIGVALER
ncbi:UDP-glycosyltransferase 73C1 [Acorus calamus]|uniref:Glycosyltransferase n=1 Tax=Acorus calamus TaxID=4465 RepID=A0AAV9C0V7_ACOCL|nr:UDP-glycosyltransferase 73C1 [Acorus calamus]